MALAAAFLVVPTSRCEEQPAVSDPESSAWKGLADFWGSKSFRSRFRLIPLQMKDENGAEEVSSVEAQNPDSALLAEPPAKPFIPATMVEGRLTSRMDVAYEVERLKSTVGSRSDKSARAPSSTLLAVLKENQAERQRLQQESHSNPQTMIASRSSAPQAKPTIKPATEKADSRSKPFLLLAKLDTRKAQNGQASSGDGKGPKIALLLARNPNRARTSRKAPNTTGADSEEKAVGPIRQLSSSGKEMDFSAVDSGGAPFHVFDIDPSETFLIELDGGEVGRVQEQGKEWAWLQLDSGLMGVMRNKHLRPASRDEVMEFLALETAGSDDPSQEMAIGVMELDLDMADLALSGLASDAAPEITPAEIPTDRNVSEPIRKDAQPLE